MQAIPRGEISGDMVTLIFFISMLLAGLLKLINSQKITEYSQLFFNFNKGSIETEAEENNSYFSGFHVLFFFYYTLSYTLLLYFLIGHLDSDFKKSFFSFSSLFLGVFCYVLGRRMLEYLLSILFRSVTTIRYFLVYKYSYANASALMILPIMMIYFYGYSNEYILFISFVIILVFRTLFLITNNKNIIRKNLFYFILYICTLEIAPLSILITFIF